VPKEEAFESTTKIAKPLPVVTQTTTKTTSSSSMKSSKRTRKNKTFKSKNKDKNRLNKKLENLENELNKLTNSQSSKKVNKTNKIRKAKKTLHKQIAPPQKMSQHNKFNLVKLNKGGEKKSLDDDLSINLASVETILIDENYDSDEYDFMVQTTRKPAPKESDDDDEDEDAEENEEGDDENEDEEEGNDDEEGEEEDDEESDDGDEDEDGEDGEDEDDDYDEDYDILENGVGDESMVLNGKIPWKITSAKPTTEAENLPDPCEPNPCNSGKCEKHSNGGYRCRCPPGTYGRRCHLCNFV
jgi:hypothetical protein